MIFMIALHPRSLDCGRQPRYLVSEVSGVNMRGVKFLVDKNGKKTAVVLDLRKNAALWEDVYDSALARSRAREPRESLASVRRRLQRTGKLKRSA